MASSNPGTQVQQSHTALPTNESPQAGSGADAHAPPAKLPDGQVVLHRLPGTPTSLLAELPGEASNSDSDSASAVAEQVERAAGRMATRLSDEEITALTAEAERVSKRAYLTQLYGLFLYALSTICGTGMSLFAKLAGRGDVGVFEVVLFRSLALIAFTAPGLLWARLNPFEDNRRWLYVMRGALGFCSTSSLYLAVTLLPMADAAVLAFLSPVWVALLSPLLLREHPSKTVYLAIPFCMVGVVLTARPSFIFGGSTDRISLVGVLVGLVQALFNASARMSVRAIHSLGGEESMNAIIFSMGFVSALLAVATLALPGQGLVWPTAASTWLALAGNGFLGYGNQVTLTAALQRAKAAPAVAMGYLSVVWGLLADVLIFGDYPTSLSLVGAAIVCMSSFFVAFGERRQRSKEKAAIRWKASQLRLVRDGSVVANLEEQLLPSREGSEECWFDAAAEPAGSAADAESGQATSGELDWQPSQLLRAASGRAVVLRTASGRVHGSSTSLVGA